MAAANDANAKKKRKRKLPALAAHLAPSVPLDDPSNHQGRTHTTPHVDGQWAAYVYVPIVVRRGMLRRIVERAVDISRKGNAGHTLGGSGSARDLDSDVVREPHVSLTRPFFLRAHQKEEMNRVVRYAARAHPPFVASFAAFSDLTNDERTRTFLCIEVGAGHRELRALSDTLTPALRSFHRKEYYEQPRFHASFALALLDRPAQSSPDQSPEPPETTMLSEDPTSDSTNGFPTIPRLPRTSSLR